MPKIDSRQYIPTQYLSTCNGSHRGKLFTTTHHSSSPVDLLKHLQTPPSRTYWDTRQVVTFVTVERYTTSRHKNRRSFLCTSHHSEARAGLPQFHRSFCSFSRWSPQVLCVSSLDVNSSTPGYDYLEGKQNPTQLRSTTMYTDSYLEFNT